MTKTDPTELLVTNPQLDPQRIADMVAFRERMEQAGFKIRTTYRLEPALGSLVLTSARQRLP